VSPKLQGFCHALSPEGKSQVIGGPPWYFAYDMMMIIYKADVDHITRHIPDPMTPSITDPEGCSVRFSSFLSVWKGAEDMISINPERCDFNETALLANCKLKDQEGQKLTYMWVDNDFTLLRGWILGAPKKEGRTYTSFDKRHLFGLNPAIPAFGPGTKLKSICEAHGERLVAGEMTLDKKITPDKLPSSMRREIFNEMHFPNIELDDPKPLVHRIVAAVADIQLGDVWECKNADLHFYESEIEEHYNLRPKEITGAYFISMGLTIKGNKTLYDYNK